MINEFFKNKNWSSKVVGEFLKELGKTENAYTPEEKCKFVEKIAKDLLMHGGNANISSAENLLIYATQHYFSNTTPQVKASIYYVLGHLYEMHKLNFVRAYTFYEKYTLNNQQNSGTHAVMLKALILRDNFTYSDELEKEFRMSLAEADLGLKNDRIYENLGRYIILKHEGNEDEATRVMKRLWGIIKTDELILPDLIIKKSLDDRVRVPQKIIEFIKEGYNFISNNQSQENVSTN